MMIALTSSDTHVKAAVSVDEAVAHMRILDADVDSTYIESLIAAATDYVELATGQTLGVRTRHFAIISDRRPEYLSYLPVYFGTEDVDPPSLVRVADDGTQTAVTVNTEALRRGYVSADDLVELHDHFILTVPMGSDSVDSLARAAVLMLVSHWYEHREAVDDGRTLNEIPFSLRSIISLIRRPVIA